MPANTTIQIRTNLPLILQKFTEVTVSEQSETKTVERDFCVPDWGAWEKLSTLTLERGNRNASQLEKEGG